MTGLIASSTELAARLQRGEAALFPTDTLPAIAARPAHAELLWELKQRPLHKPVILMAASAAELWPCLGVPLQDSWLQLAEQHWPGALTLVLPARGELMAQLNPGGSSLGLRVPASEAALELLRHSGPLATTSANRSGEDPCLSAAEAAARFPGVACLAPVPWPEPSGQASTVLQWQPGADGPGRWQLLRAGAVMPAGLPLARP